jgi:hypothetical protein
MAKGTPVIGQRYPGNCKGTPEVYKGTPEVLRLALAAVYSRICSQNQTWIAYFLGENSTQTADFSRKIYDPLYFGKTKNVFWKSEKGKFRRKGDENIKI